jgi:DNA-binding NarL/FixJ family response regulator
MRTVTVVSNDVIQNVDDSKFIAQAYSRAVALGAQCSRPLVRRDHERLPGIVLKLTPRERQIVDLLITGAENKFIATKLGITVRTVKEHLLHMYRKNGIIGGILRVKLAVMAYRERAK